LDCLNRLLILSFRLANSDPEYYNDLPGKLPPESQVAGKASQNGKRTKPTPTLTLDPTSNKGKFDTLEHEGIIRAQSI